MAINRVTESIEESHRSKLTSAGKTENENIETINIEQTNTTQSKEKNKNIKSKKQNVKVEKSFELEEIQNENNFADFSLKKKEEPEIKKNKIYYIKLSNINKIKELASKTGISESGLIDFLIENGSKVITIK